jgi:1,2-diacylglycerol 3-beta-glucosyltransferase
MFHGLPVWSQVLYWIAFAIIVVNVVWAGTLFACSRRALHSAPEPRPDGADDFLWVFLVPALNEAATIADSVARLLAVEARHKVILVIDDGSTDGTAAVLESLERPELQVLSRVPPDARRGKGAALNAAWRRLDQLLASGPFAGWQRERVIVCVVDADGRLDPKATLYAAAHFADEHIGGLQVRVRIYNRSRFLTWCQDVEFGVYGLLFQAGRTAFGVAGMGGNGQFNRLTALDQLADPVTGGPWRDRLTEDQDLGLRLLDAGWRTVAEARTSVDQQGLPGLRPLLRQRTRWAQGNLQAMSQLGEMARLARPWSVRLDQVGYLLQPVFQAVVGIAFAVSIGFAIVGVAPFWGSAEWWLLVVFFLLGYGGVVLGCIARGAGTGAGGVLRGILITPVYAAYTWLIWPVLARATARQLTRRSGWAKTAREPIGKSAA